MLTLKFLNNLLGPVGGGAINNQNFKKMAIIILLDDGFETAVNVRFFVSHRNDDGNKGLHKQSEAALSKWW